MGTYVRRWGREITGLLCLLVSFLYAVAIATPLTAQEEAPQPGETIRVTLAESAADRLRVPMPLEATFVMLQGSSVVADTRFSGAIRLPVDDIETLEVQRSRSLASSVAIGTGAGVVLGVGMWQFLGVLCGSGCDTSDASTWAPALASAVLVGVFVGARASSGQRWVPASIGG